MLFSGCWGTSETPAVWDSRSKSPFVPAGLAGRSACSSPRERGSLASGAESRGVGLGVTVGRLGTPSATENLALIADNPGATPPGAKVVGRRRRERRGGGGR